MFPEFVKFPKLSRLNRGMVVTEKIDGTNAQVFIDQDGRVWAGSRNRWLTVSNDNHGFAAWVESNKEQLLGLGPGHHYGEWWGRGIQRSYGKTDRTFSLFNVNRWSLEDPEKSPPECCSVVPTLYRGPFCTDMVSEIVELLKKNGSFAAGGFMDPEGVVVLQCGHGNHLYKVTCENDDSPKGLVNEKEG